MCLAIPVKITALHDSDRATANIGGIEREISIALLDHIQVGDYVIVHVGYALNKLDEEEAQKTLELFEEIARLDQLTQVSEDPHEIH